MLVFDRVENLSSTMLSVLIALAVRLRHLGCELRLAGVSDELRIIFKMTKLDRVLALDDDVETALSHLLRPHGCAWNYSRPDQSNCPLPRSGGYTNAGGSESPSLLLGGGQMAATFKTSKKCSRAFSLSELVMVIVIIELLDRRIVDTGHIKALSIALDRIVTNHPAARLVLAFDRVQNLSSTMLSALIALAGLLRRLGFELRLAGVSDELRGIFKMTGLDCVMALDADVETALSRLPRPLARSA